MNSIEQIKDYGKDRRLLIVGRGMSVLDFRFDLLPGDIDIMAVNESRFEMTKYGHDIIPQYMIYMDVCERDFIVKNGLREGIILITYKDNACDRVDYFYDKSTVQMDGATTVYYALQIGEILGYREQYLIGVDMQPGASGQIRYVGDHKITPFDRKEYIEKNFKAMIASFDKREWKTPIFNCNPNSKLTKFPYGVPWK